MVLRKTLAGLGILAASLFVANDLSTREATLEIGPAIYNVHRSGEKRVISHSGPCSITWLYDNESDGKLDGVTFRIFSGRPFGAGGTYKREPTEEEQRLYEERILPELE